MKKLNKVGVALVAGLGLLTVGTTVCKADNNNFINDIPIDWFNPRVNKSQNNNSTNKSNRFEPYYFNGSKGDMLNMRHFIHVRHHYLYSNVGGNTRDLGGYKTADGKYRIRRDRIIRSADLNNVNMNKIKKLHVSYIIDLRNRGKNEIDGHPDPGELHKHNNIKGVRYVINPVYTQNEYNDFKNKEKEYGIYYYYGEPAVINKNAIKSYKKTFKILLHNKKGAVLFHCTLGRDRTGTTAALILSALGVSRKEIYHDYLLTYHYKYRFHQNSHESPDIRQTDKLHRFFRTIEYHYGSVQIYLHDVIGLNEHDINKLHKKYLEPVHKHAKHAGDIYVYHHRHVHYDLDNLL